MHSSFVSLVRLVTGVLLLATAPVAAAGCGDSRPPAAAAAARIESHVYAPCCWTQTLDSHRSPLADELRAEIRTRLDGGESAALIEDDLVARYGERMRAVPRGFDAERLVWPLVAVALAAAFLVAWWASRRTLRAPALAPLAAAPGAGAVSLDLQDRLDDELREID